MAHLYSEHGVHPIWELEHQGERVAFFQPGVGAPLAALFFEEAIDYGCRALVACGGAGALDAALALGHPVVVSAAVRDEGTSYHYLAPSRIVEAAPAVVSTMERVLGRSGRPVHDRDDVVDRCRLPRDQGQGGAPASRGLHHRRDGGGRAASRGGFRGVSFGPAPLRRRQSRRRGLGPPGLGARP